MIEVFTRFSQGGAFMWVIGAVGVWMLAVAIDRFYTIFIKSSVNAGVVMEQVERFVTAGDSASAIKYLNGLAHKPLARVLRAALLHADSNIEKIGNAIDEVVLEVLPKLQRRTVYLFTLANVATLLGLMGTITGLTRSFGSLDINDPAAQARALGSGISEAMLTTAFGLVVAVPATLVHTIIQSRTEQIIEEIDHSTSRLINLLTQSPKKSLTK